MAITVERVVQEYISTRDAMDVVAARHKEELKPFVDKLEKLNSWLMGTLQAAGAKSSRTDYGTAYIVENTNLKVEDPEAFFDFVTNSGEFQLLNRSPSKSAVKEYADEHRGELPPGLSSTSILSLNVRRA
jgi:hypothetical protein